MSIQLFDVQIGFGGRISGVPESVSAEEILAEMHRMDIAHALVRIEPEKSDVDVTLSNDTLFHVCVDNDSFIPCPVVTPNTCYDLPTEEEQVANAIKHKAGAMIIRPEIEHWVFQECVCGRMFAALQDRKMPVYCALSLVTVEQVFRLAKQYPELPLIVTGISYRELRILLPLLQNYRNVQLSTGPAFSIHLGIEYLVEHAGAERLLFGSGLPGSSPMASISQLMYAGISDEEKAMIGSGNFYKLTEEIN